MGEKVTATEKYGLSNFHMEQYTDSESEVIDLCAQLISAKLKKAALLLTNTTTISPVSRVMRAIDKTYRTQRA